jgi:hypothetical protein
MATNATPLTLDYCMCTLSELRGFIRDRRNLNAAEFGALRNYHRSYLVGCLEHLDRNATFRFADLAPEIRLEVYRHLLVGRDREGPHAPVRVIETAILRTCKAIYAEAEPVLYSDNLFGVAINANPDEDTTDDEADTSDCNHYHYTAIYRPGNYPTYSFSQDDWADQYPTLSDHMVSSSCLDMLRRVRHLHIFIGDCTFTTQEVIACLCMMLSGTIEMKTLTVTLQPSHIGIDHKELAKIFWPLAFVHTRLGFTFATEDEDEALDNKMTEALEGMAAESQVYWMPMLAYTHPGLEQPGDLIAQARARAAHLIKRHGRDWRYLRSTDLMVNELVRCIGEIGEINQIAAFVWAWGNLASYVHESDRNLEILEQMARDVRYPPRTFPSRYAEFRGRGARAGEPSLQTRLEMESNLQWLLSTE